MKIGIDVRYLSHGIVGGVHRYVATLVPALLERAPQHQFVLYADTKRDLELRDLPENAQVMLLPYRNALSSAWNDLTIGGRMAADGIEVAHFPANVGIVPRGLRSVVTLHDAINILPLAEILRGHRKDIRTVAMMSYLHMLSSATVQRAAMLITVSEYSKREILKHAGFPAEKIVPITHGPAARFRRESDSQRLAETRSRLGISHDFVLADALKNPSTLVNAWALLPEAIRRTHRMVFFCRNANPPEAVAAAVAAGNAILLVKPAMEDLVALYSMARAFVFPSLIEGLGLPLLEAMQCGAPVIASNRGSIPEVAGKAALYADALDAAGFAEHIRSVIETPDQAAAMAALGFERAAHFSWADTADRVLQVYARAASTPAVSRPGAARPADAAAFRDEKVMP